jgi:hypothetical protein
LLKFGRKSALEEAEEPEPKERTVTVLNLTEGLGLIAAGVKVFEDSDWNEQRAATNRQGLMRMTACYEESPKEK